MSKRETAQKLAPNKVLANTILSGFYSTKAVAGNVQNTDTEAEAKKEEEEEEEEKARARRETVERRATAPLRAQSIERASTLSP
jgi:NAD(P)-dependent dehydrogenase (short-subunit alcohol dehydrogenase family)